MKFAIYEGLKVEAAPKSRAECPVCGAPLVSRCGRFVRWHWAHLPGAPCGDPWAEPETLWHRAWKDRFPAAWQEVAVFDDALTDCHIADVKTTSGLVIEFQRSTINLDEVEARERFHGRMIWVVDGTRNEFDRYNFKNMRSSPSNGGIVHFHWFGRSKLFDRWHTTKPVFIDFGPEHGFWRILRFDLASRRGIAGLVDIEAFVRAACSGTTDFSANGGPASV